MDQRTATAGMGMVLGPWELPLVAVIYTTALRASRPAEHAQLRAILVIEPGDSPVRKQATLHRTLRQCQYTHDKTGKFDTSKRGSIFPDSAIDRGFHGVFVTQNL